MAFTISVNEKTVFGNMRVHVLSCSVDSASGNIDTGLSNVYGYALGVVSMATAGPIMKKNVGSAATARPGIINIHAAASGDVFLLTVYGV